MLDIDNASIEELRNEIRRLHRYYFYVVSSLVHQLREKERIIHDSEDNTDID